MKVVKTLNVSGGIGMSFIGRVFARLRHGQRKARLNVDAVQLEIKDSKLTIYDGIHVVLQAEKQLNQDWEINLTEQYARLFPQ